MSAVVRRTLGVACLTTIGCAQPPLDEVALAEARVERARRAEAATFAPLPFEAAEAAVAQARRHLEQAPEYRAALRAAAVATREADEAYRQASVSRAIVARRTARLLREMESLLEMAMERGAAAAPEELEGLRERYAQVEATAARGDLLDALAEGEAVKPALIDFERRFRR